MSGQHIEASRNDVTTDVGHGKAPEVTITSHNTATDDVTVGVDSLRPQGQPSNCGEDGLSCLPCDGRQDADNGGNDKPTAEDQEDNVKDKTPSAVRQAIGQDKTPSAVSQVIGQDKTLSTVRQAIGQDKTSSTVSQAIGQDKTSSTVSQAIGQDKTPPAVSQTIGQDKTPSTVSQTIGQDKTLSAVSQAIGQDKTPSTVSQAIGQDKTSSAARQTGGQEGKVCSDPFRESSGVQGSMAAPINTRDPEDLGTPSHSQPRPELAQKGPGAPVADPHCLSPTVNTSCRHGNVSPTGDSDCHYNFSTTEDTDRRHDDVFPTGDTDCRHDNVFPTGETDCGHDNVPSTGDSSYGHAKEEEGKRVGPRLWCSLCDAVDVAAVAHCRECGLDLCAACVQRHGRMSLAAHHHVSYFPHHPHHHHHHGQQQEEDSNVRLAAHSARAERSATLTAVDACPKHSQEQLRFFCRTCQRPVCRDCILTSHKHHDTEDIGDATAAARTELSRMTSRLTDSKRQLEAYLQDLDSYRDSWGATVERVQAMMKGFHEQVKANLAASYQQVLDDVEACRRAEVGRIDTLQQTACDTLQDVTRLAAQQDSRTSSSIRVLSQHEVVAHALKTLEQTMRQLQVGEGEVVVCTNPRLLKQSRQWLGQVAFMVHSHRQQAQGSNQHASPRPTEQAHKNDPPTQSDDPHTQHIDPLTQRNEPPTHYNDPKTHYNDPKTHYSNPPTHYSDPQTHYSDPQTQRKDLPPQTGDRLVPVPAARQLVAVREVSLRRQLAFHVWETGSARSGVRSIVETASRTVWVATPRALLRVGSTSSTVSRASSSVPDDINGLAAGPGDKLLVSLGRGSSIKVYAGGAWTSFATVPRGCTLVASRPQDRGGVRVYVVVTSLQGTTRLLAYSTDGQACTQLPLPPHLSGPTNASNNTANIGSDAGGSERRAGPVSPRLSCLAVSGDGRVCVGHMAGRSLLLLDSQGQLTGQYLGPDGHSGCCPTSACVTATGQVSRTCRPPECLRYRHRAGESQ